MDEFENHNLEDTVPEQDWISSANVVRTDKTLVVKNFFVVNDSEAQFNRGQRISRKAVSGNYTLAVIDYLVGVTSFAIAPSIGLPKPSMAAQGKIYVVKDEVGGASSTTITIKSDGEKTIDGGTSLTITSAYGVQRLYTDGANWFTY